MSLTLHGAILLCLLATYPVLRPRGPAMSYDVVVVPEVAEPPTPADAPKAPELETQAQAAPEPATPPVAPAPQEPATPHVAQAPPEPATSHVAQAPAAEPPPSPQAERAPPPGIAEPAPAEAPARVAERPRPVVRNRPHEVASVPRPHKREAGPMEAERPAEPSAVLRGAAGPPVAAASPQETTGPDPVWLARVSAWLTAHQSYPEIARRRGEQGTVLVRFEADRSGQVLNASLVRGSGMLRLDEAAVALVQSARLPPFPPDMRATREIVTIPVNYRLE